MGKNLVHKILEAHLVEGRIEPGREIGIRIDQTLTQDITGTMACMEYEAMGDGPVRTLRSVNYCDHNLMQLGHENADDHEYLRTISARCGMYFSRPGNGICHQVHLERFSKTGQTLLGADSHTPTCGGAGMVAIGAGGIDVALAMSGQPFFLSCPKVLNVRLTGVLKPFVTAKDIILKVLEVLGTSGNVGWAIEYTGPGLEMLSVPERSTITNMGAETGVTTSVFPSDSVTAEFFAIQDRAGDWQPLAADPDAEYDRLIEIDLSDLEPMVATPHSPGNVVPVRKTAGVKVDQVCIGSCTNSSIKDLLIVAALLKGRKIHGDVALIVAPGSRQVLRNIAHGEALEDIIAAGARLDEAGCGFCIGSAQAPRSGAISVRTINRNFAGRCGTKDADVYLTSPETAVACAITGIMTDPRDLGFEYPKIAAPGKIAIDDSMIVSPAEKPESVEIFRGPSHCAPLDFDPPPDRIEGAVEIKVGDKVTTDDIMPAGRLATYRSNIPRYAEFVFYRLDPDFSARCRAKQEAKRASFIVAGDSYGQGSSREHAALCPRYVGVRAVFAKSFERLHVANLINFGILPLLFASDGDYEALEPGDELQLDGVTEAIKNGETLQVRNRTRDTEFTARLVLTARTRSILLAGGV
ncbi:MAG: aconitate hydratase, partial [Phycisphaerae bacterium]|nr:aconitate hydratase [Phycisphaerae bacterium]